MIAYYNENDAYAAQWLRNLITAGRIALGIVDERSIEDVEPEFLKQFTQCHFFAGIGAWSHALRSAGWPDDRPVWTGSCPCQPFSAAGKRGGTADERHLWPAWHYLIRECNPPSVFGEQVEAAIGHGWLDLVQNDLEGIGYAVGSAVVPATGVGAPHIRSRLWFVADRLADPLHGVDQRTVGRSAGETEGAEAGYGTGVFESGELSGTSEPIRGLADMQHERPQGWTDSEREDQYGRAGRSGAAGGFWKDADWLGCRDGKWRPVEPGTFPLVNGASSRVGRLRAYGNAICAPVAQAFIGAYL